MPFAFPDVATAQLMLNQVLYYLDENFGGIDKYGLPVFAKIPAETWKGMMDNYYAFKQTRKAAFGITAPHVLAGSVGANKTTFETGGSQDKATTPTFW